MRRFWISKHALDLGIIAEIECEGYERREGLKIYIRALKVLITLLKCK
jgi:hypothetical protein